MTFIEALHTGAVWAVRITVGAFAVYGLVRLFARRSPSETITAKSRIITALTRTIARIARIIFSRPVIAASVVVLVILSFAFWDFVSTHPGVVLVLLGVAGETIWEGKKHSLEHAMCRFSAFMLIAGLVVEMGEAVVHDRELTGLRERAAGAERASAEAHEKARVADEKAAKAELELIQLKEKLKPRSIPGELRNEFIAALADSPKGEVVMCFSSPDGDVPSFTEELQRMLGIAGFRVEGKPQSVNFAINGVAAPWFLALICEHSNPPPHAIRIQKAFEKIGIDAKANEPQPQLKLKADAVAIYVGSKR